MDAIFHEQQEGSLCAQHCINSLLQGQFYSAVDLAELAQELDSLEVSHMASQGDSEEYRRFLQQPSINMDDSGFFSVQVISKALSVWGLELVPFSSSDPMAVRARQSPLAANAYICNYREHWFTIRRLGSQWFNLNSLLEYPELVSNTYLGEFLAQLRQEGYSIFIVKGDLPECDADLILQAVPAVQHTRPRLLADVQSSGANSRASAAGGGSSAPSSNLQSSSATRDEEADLEAAMMLSLAENVPGPEGGPATIDNNELQMALGRESGGVPGDYRDEDAEMQMALALSQSETSRPVQVPQESEEDELQRAISMSLAAGGSLPQAQSQPQANVSQSGGWGSRLAEQEAAEEQRYLEEQARQQQEEEEELRKALEMSMQDDMKAEPPIVNVGGVLKHKKLTTPTGARLDSSDSSSGSVKPSSQSSSGEAPGPSPASTRALPAGSAASLAKVPPASLSKPGTSSSSASKSSSSNSSAAAAAAGSSKVGPSASSPAKSAQPVVSPAKSAQPAAENALPQVGGHTLGGARRPPSGETDPAEIRRRRLAFLDNMNKNKQNPQ